MHSMQFMKLCLLPITLAGTWCSSALADDFVVAPPQSRTTTETSTEKGGPSRLLLMSGVATFGLTYGAGAVVAATSDRDPDHRMFVPVVGPWMALVDRGGCGGSTGPSCNTETTNKVLIVADGVGQGLGILMIVDAFLSPETVTVSRSRTAFGTTSLRFSPTTLPGGAYGVLATGMF